MFLSQIKETGRYDSCGRPTYVQHIINIQSKATKDKKRSKETGGAQKGDDDGNNDDGDDSDAEPQMSESNGNLCFIKGIFGKSIIFRSIRF